MHRLVSAVVVAVFAIACAPEPKASRVEVAPLPTHGTGTSSDDPSGGGGGGSGAIRMKPNDDMRLTVHDGVGDRDGDGIKDSMDKCPDDPEDFDGFEDEDGCPDPDNDRDGIPDTQDKCPNIPGPPPDGCPKSRP